MINKKDREARNKEAFFHFCALMKNKNLKMYEIEDEMKLTHKIGKQTLNRMFQFYGDNYYQNEKVSENTFK